MNERVLEYLSNVDTPQTLDQIVTAMQAPSSSIRLVLYRLGQRGKVRRLRVGKDITGNYGKAHVLYAAVRDGDTASLAVTKSPSNVSIMNEQPQITEIPLPTADFFDLVYLPKSDLDAAERELGRLRAENRDLKVKAGIAREEADKLRREVDHLAREVSTLRRVRVTNASGRLNNLRPASDFADSSAGLPPRGFEPLFMRPIVSDIIRGDDSILPSTSWRDEMYQSVSLATLVFTVLRR